LSRVHDEIIKNYDERRSFPDKGRLCPEDLDLFRRWRWNETVNDRNSNALTSQGIMDMKFLARRYASKFEDLMREPYSENTYSVSYRSKMSLWIANPDWFCSFNILTLIGLMTATRLTSRGCSRTTHIKYTPTSSILID
jgi:hypothetical protein